MFKKIIITLLAIGLFVPFFNFAFAAEEQYQTDVYFFWSIGCPFCAKEKVLLQKIIAQYPSVKIHDFELSQNKENMDLLQKIGALTKIEISHVPITIVGTNYFPGYQEYLNPNPIETRIVQCVKDGCPDSLGQVINKIKNPNSLTSSSGEQNGKSSTTPSGSVQKIKIPLFGEVPLASLSLPVLSVVLGGLDGFNPCAMWVLLFLISLLLGTHDRKKMWLLGGAFLVASAAVYFIFMAAWLNLIIFLGFIFWIRALIGLVALIGGGLNLKKFFEFKQDTCEVMGENKKLTVIDKMKAIIQKQNLWFALIGIVALSFSVNLVEMVCSAGLPVIFTQILAVNHLAWWQYGFYMFIYIFMYMLDDIIIFTLAMITLQMSGMTSKYARYSHLVGGVLMVIVGLLLIFKPAWLSFG
ncbi:MAG: hypothetical protein PHN74_03030 [Candidatus Pacebacteria bacterium]|nr:hypothetical protein [Candidatus Paceibacterota bacterium]